MEESTQVFLYLAFSFAVKLSASAVRSKRRPERAEKVGEVARVVLYPGKSFGGIDLQSGVCKQDGLYHPNHLAYDR